MATNITREHFPHRINVFFPRDNMNDAMEEIFHWCFSEISIYQGTSKSMRRHWDKFVRLGGITPSMESTWFAASRSNAWRFYFVNSDDMFRFKLSWNEYTQVPKHLADSFKG